MSDTTIAAGRRLGRLPALDGVRGVAVLLVMALHVGLMLRPGTGLAPGGLIGVDMFFVLSGFLITSLLLDERSVTGGVSMRAFYMRRALRLLPALFALMAVQFGYALAKNVPVQTEIKRLLPIIFYVSNWAQSMGGHVPKELGHTWTLAVEEQFYLVWPAVVLLLVHFVRSRRGVVSLLTLGIIASALIRAWIWKYGSHWPAAYMRTAARADGLLMGALAAFLWRWNALAVRWVRAVAWAAVAGLVVMVPLWKATSSGMFYGGFTVAAFGTAAIIVAVALGGWRLERLFALRPLRAVGRVSYGLYLWHVFIITVIGAELPKWSRSERALLAVVLSAIATVLSWWLVEAPFLRLKERFVRRARTPGPPVAAEAPAPA